MIGHSKVFWNVGRNKPVRAQRRTGVSGIADAPKTPACRYAPAGLFRPTRLKSDKSVAELIGELKATEQQIISGLDKLLAMVEGRE